MAVELGWIDITVIAVYFVIVLGIGLYFLRKGKNSKDFFLASGDVSWWAIGCSLFASNIGSEHFIGLASSGAKNGMCVSWGEWYSPLFILLLGWLFVPFYLRSQVYTLPEFLERRYNRTCRIYLSAFSMFMYILTKISVTLFAGALVLNVLLSWNTWLSIGALIVATGIYTICGGMSAIIYTEVIQTFILIAGGLAVLIQGLINVGGWEGLTNILSEEGRPDMMHLIQPPTHPDFPWTGVVFGMPFTSLWYWCTDQVIVQRTLSAKDRQHATGGCVSAGYLKILPPFLMVVPGMIASAIIPEVRTNPNVAFVSLATTVLPAGLMGLVIATMLAALMSSLASVFHSSSTLFTIDMYRFIKLKVVQRMRNRKQLAASPEQPISPSDSNNLTEENVASDRELVIVGRVSAAIVMLCGIAWIPLVQMLSDQLYIYTHKVMSYCAPPISVVFMMGVLWKRGNSAGALSALIAGLIIGMTRLILEAIFISVPANTNLFLDIFVHSNFLHFSACFGLTCIIIYVVASLLTEKPSEEKLNGLTLWTNSTTSMFSRLDNEQSSSGVDLVDVASSDSLAKSSTVDLVEAESSNVVADGVTSVKKGSLLRSEKMSLAVNITFSALLVASLATLYAVFA